MKKLWYSVLIWVLVANSTQASENAVLLEDYSPCGLTSLYLVCQIKGIDVGFQRMKDLVGSPGPDGSHSFTALSKAAEEVKLHPVGLQINRDGLSRMPMPAIVQVRDPQEQDPAPHLLVLLRATSDGVHLIDPPYPAYFIHWNQFQTVWTGNTLVFAASAVEAQQIRKDAADPRLWGAGLTLWSVVGLVAVLLIGLRLGWFSQVWVSLRTRLALRVLIAAAVLITLGGALYGIGVVLARTPPTCVFEKQVIDLGELTPGEHEVQVPVHNKGDAELVIEEVLSTCSCAVVDTPRSVSPRQTRTMVIKLNVATGRRKARVELKSNDPKGSKNVMLVWTGTPRLLLFPHRVDVLSAPADRSLKRIVRVVYPSGKSAIAPHFDRIECPVPGVSVRPVSNNPEALRLGVSGLLLNVLGEYELEVTVHPPGTPGLFATICKVFVSIGGTSTVFDLPIHLNFVADPSPDVRAVIFSASDRHHLSGQERTVTVTQEKAGELEVGNLPGWVKCRVIKTSERQHTLSLKLMDYPARLPAEHALTLTAKKTGARSTLPIYVFASD